MTLAPRYFEIADGITCIDTMLHRPAMVACYLIRQGKTAGFIDTGVAQNVPMLLEILRRKGIARADVAFVMPTHVHLDHAGGAGQLMQALPNARLLIHPRGARHMIDPSKLQAGSMAVYGPVRYREIFGDLIAIDESRVVVMDDGQVLDFNGRPLTFIHTQGHARHHYCIYDSRSSGLFTGDTFGASYSELNNGRRPFIFPPTTPIQFDPAAWKSSLEKLMTLNPARIYVTHFGMQENVEVLYRLLTQAIDDYAAIAEDCKSDDEMASCIQQKIMEHSVNYILDTGGQLDTRIITEFLAMDMQLNAQGLEYWIKTRNPAATGVS